MVAVLEVLIPDFTTGSIFSAMRNLLRAGNFLPDLSTVDLFFGVEAGFGKSVSACRLTVMDTAIVFIAFVDIAAILWRVCRSL